MEQNKTCIENIHRTEGISDTNDEYFEIKIPLNLFQYLSADNCDLQSLCRICLSIENELMFPMWPTQDNNVLADMYTSLTTISISANDGLPLNICSTCQTQMINCCDFKSLCERSNYTLRSILKGVLIAKDDISDNNGSAQYAPETELKNKSNSQDETTVNEDIQYLEDLVGFPNENQEVDNEDNLVQNEQKQVIFSVTDSKSLLNEVVSENIASHKKRRKNHICSFCGKNYMKLKTLRVHIKNNHQPSDLPHECNQCKEAFNSEHDLNLHSALHTKGTSWKCNKCEKEYNSKQVLRRHIQRHMEMKRFACETCGKRFIELYALRRHARVHTGETVEKKHACPLCDKK